MLRDSPDILFGVSVCVFRDGEVLMVRRGKPPGAGLWAPIGGGIEPGESAAAAALRETLEETATTVRLLGIAGRRTFLRRPGDGRGPGRIDLTVFSALHLAGEPIPGDDAAEARFVAIPALSGFDLVPGVLPFVHVARLLASGRATGGSATHR
jgi:ADP-ribose pyrophosphatase YjhB (NUDIX family)